MQGKKKEKKDPPSILGENESHFAKEKRNPMILFCICEQNSLYKPKEC